MAAKRNFAKNLPKTTRNQRVTKWRRHVAVSAFAVFGANVCWAAMQCSLSAYETNDVGENGAQVVEKKEVVISSRFETVDWFQQDWDFDAETFTLPPEAVDAIDERLGALAARQNPDGSFGSDGELFGRDPGVAALCGFAFLASGSAPGRGRFGGELEKIVDYILSQSFDAKGQEGDAFDLDFLKYLEENELKPADVDGLIANFSEKGRKPMYGHGFATLFLAAVLGETNREDVRKRTRAAVELIVRAQNSDGGWRYEPTAVQVADLSVTVCQLSALRAARDAGIFVPEATVEMAMAYVARCQNSDGGFRYMTLAGPSGVARTSAAILALQAGGNDDSEAVASAFRYLEQAAPLAASGGVSRVNTGGSAIDGNAANVPNDDIPRLPTSRFEYYFYGEFYAALAYWRGARDTASRERWARWARRAYPNLLAKREDDGLWRSNVSTDAETAFVLCALLTPFERTPFFLR